VHCRMTFRAFFDRLKIKKFVSARHQNQHARRVRSPDNHAFA